MYQDFISSAILSLELHPGFAAFAVKAAGADRFSALQMTTFEHPPRQWMDLGYVSDWLKKHQSVWTQHYDRVFVTLHDIPFTIVPEPEGSEEVLCSLTGIAYQQYHFSIQPLHPSWNWVMAVPADLSHLLHNYFNKPTFIVGIHGFIKQLEIKADSENTAGLYVTPEILYFTFLKNKQPVFSNVYHYSAKEDLLYYTLLTFKALHLDANSDPLLVGGMITGTSPLFEILYQYIRNVSLADWSLPVDPLSLEKTGFPAHAFVNLIGAAE